MHFAINQVRHVSLILQRKAGKRQLINTAKHFFMSKCRRKEKASNYLFKKKKKILISKANSRHFSFQTISIKQHYPSPQSVYIYIYSVCVCVLHIVMHEPLLMCTLWVSFCEIADIIFHLDVHYVCYVCLALRAAR